MKTGKNFIQIGNSKGQAITEFTVTFPIFFILFFWSFQFGSAMYQVHALYKAANKGARAAVTSTGPTNAIRISAAQAAVRTALGDPNNGFYKFELVEPIEVTIPTDGTPITVTVKAKPKMVFMKNFRKDPLTGNLRNYSVTASAFPNYRGRPINTAPKP